MASKAANYKLIYLTMRGSAEMIRFIFAYAGVEYQDHRVSYSEVHAMKPNLPFGLVPVLEFDGGDQLGESNAIAEFLAKRFNIAGKTEVEVAKVNSVGDYVVEAKEPFFAWVMEKDKERQKVVKEKYFKEGVHTNLSVLENVLKRNNGGDGFFIGSSPTWADFSVACFLFELQQMQSDLLDKYPLLNAHNIRVHDLPAIEEWIKKRPADVIQ